MLTDLFRLFAMTVSQNLCSTRSERRAACVRHVLDRQCTDPIDVTILACEMHVSRRQLERDFRRWVGVGLVEYARRRRFDLAAHALSGDRSIVQVALDHGYADQAHFTRVARRFAGCTPGVLRANEISASRAESGSIGTQSRPWAGTCAAAVVPNELSRRAA
jgi:AraC-like DNA-binding protein